MTLKFVRLVAYEVFSTLVSRQALLYALSAVLLPVVAVVWCSHVATARLGFVIDTVWGLSPVLPAVLGTYICANEFESRTEKTGILLSGSRFHALGSKFVAVWVVVSLCFLSMLLCAFAALEVLGESVSFAQFVNSPPSLVSACAAWLYMSLLWGSVATLVKSHTITSIVVVGISLGLSNLLVGIHAGFSYLPDLACQPLLRGASSASTLSLSTSATVCSGFLVTCLILTVFVTSRRSYR